MRTNHSARLFIIVTLFASAGFAGPNTGARKSPEFREAQAALEAQDVPKAYGLLLSLWEKNPTYDVAAVLGQVEIYQGKYLDAAGHLAFSVKNTPADQGEALQRTLAEFSKAKEHVTTLRVAVDVAETKSAVDGAEIFVNGKSIGTSPLSTEVFVEPGHIDLIAKHPTQGQGEAHFEAAAAEERSVQLTLRPIVSPTGAPPKPPYASDALADPSGKLPAPTEPPTRSDSGAAISGKTVVLVVGGVVTLIAGGTATYFGLKAKSAQDDASNLSRQAEAEFGARRCSSADAQGADICTSIRKKLDDHDSKARVFNVMLPVAGVAAVATGVLYLLWPNQSIHTAQKHLTLVPVATQQSGGFMLSGSF
jgi:hypothetical protein